MRRTVLIFLMLLLPLQAVCAAAHSAHSHHGLSYAGTGLSHHSHAAISTASDTAKCFEHQQLNHSANQLSMDDCDCSGCDVHCMLGLVSMSADNTMRYSAHDTQTAYAFPPLQEFPRTQYRPPSPL